MLTKLRRTKLNIYLSIGIAALALILVGCSGGAPGQIQNPYGGEVATQAAVLPTQAVQALTQAVPLTGATATVEPTVEASQAASPTVDDSIERQYSTQGASTTDDSAEVKVSQNAELGSFLVDEKGMTLYLFTKDSPGVSNCSGDCLVNWPPLLTVKTPKADDGVDQSKLGTIQRSDGTLQVTYDQMPLYYFIGDQKPGDTTGQNVGQVWFVVPPSGAASGDDSAELKVSQTADLGTFLVDSKGMTLYLFTKDAPDVTNCSGQCLVNWPPLLTVKPPKADDGVDQAKLGTITLADGTLQVTYDHMPLYYFAGDKKPGDTAGEKVGGVWFVVAP